MAAVLCLGAGPCLAASGEPDIAVEFNRLQERLMAARSRFVARQAETRRLAETDWARAPDAALCARTTGDVLRTALKTSPARDDRSLRAARLVDLVVDRLVQDSGLQISAFCPTTIGDSGDYNADSYAAGPADPRRDDREEAAARTGALKAIILERGLILAADSDDELAAVVGHELGHLALQHLPARQELSLLGDGRAMTKGLSAPAADIAKRRMSAWGAGYNVETELEADRYGAALMARAGYDPRAFAVVLSKAEVTALRLDARGPQAVRSDFARRRAAAARFGGELKPASGASPAPRVLRRLKTLLSD